MYDNQENQTMRFNLDKITKHQKKELKKYCEAVYNGEFRSHMEWLPESIFDLTDDDIKNIAMIDAMTGSQYVTPLLKLRKSALEIKKRLH